MNTPRFLAKRNYCERSGLASTAPEHGPASHASFCGERSAIRSNSPSPLPQMPAGMPARRWEAARSFCVRRWCGSSGWRLSHTRDSQRCPPAGFTEDWIRSLPSSAATRSSLLASFWRHSNQDNRHRSASGFNRGSDQICIRSRKALWKLIWNP